MKKKTEKPELQRLNIFLPKEIIVDMKSVAALSGQTVSQYLAELHEKHKPLAITVKYADEFEKPTYGARFRKGK